MLDTSHVESKALGVERVVGPPVERFLLHTVAAPAGDVTDIEFKVDAHASARKVSHPTHFAIVPAACTRLQPPHALFFGATRQPDRPSVGVSILRGQNAHPISGRLRGVRCLRIPKRVQMTD